MSLVSLRDDVFSAAQIIFEFADPAAAAPATPPLLLDNRRACALALVANMRTRNGYAIPAHTQTGRKPRQIRRAPTLSARPTHRLSHFLSTAFRHIGAHPAEFVAAEGAGRSYNFVDRPCRYAAASQRRHRSSGSRAGDPHN